MASWCQSGEQLSNLRVLRQQRWLLANVCYPLEDGGSWLPGQRHHHSTNKAGKKAQYEMLVIVMAEGKRQRSTCLLKPPPEMTVSFLVTFHWAERDVKVKVIGAEKCIHDYLRTSILTAPPPPASLTESHFCGMDMSADKTKGSLTAEGSHGLQHLCYWWGGTLFLTQPMLPIYLFHSHEKSYLLRPCFLLE